MESVININARKSLAAKEVEDTIRRTESVLSYYNIRKDQFDAVLLEMEEEGLPISVSLCSNDVTITCTGNKVVLNKLFNILRKRGFAPSSRPKKGDTSFAAFFKHDNGARFYLSFTSSQCRRVQIGTEMVERPIYETVCDDDNMELTDG